MRAQGPQLFRTVCQPHRKRLIPGQIGANQLRQAGGAKQARPDARGEALLRAADQGHTGPQRIARAGVRIHQQRIEKHIGAGEARQMRSFGQSPTKDKTRRIDAARRRLTFQFCPRDRITLV